MIRSILILGHIGAALLDRVLEEVLEVGSDVTAGQKLVIVIESNGGDASSLFAFLEIALQDEWTRKLLGEADVKIYRADSAAANLALSLGSWREMPTGSQMVFHLPLITVQFWEVNKENRRLDPSILDEAQRNEAFLEALMARCGLNEVALKEKLHQVGSFSLTAEECLARGIVHGLFQTEPTDGSATKADDRPQGNLCRIRTILISGLITDKRLRCVLQELRDIAARASADDRVVLLFDSPGGDICAVVNFLQAIERDAGLRSLAQQAEIKIYEAHSAAALLAFSLGSRREIAAKAKAAFHLGQITVQVGDPTQLEPGGLVSVPVLAPWLKYRSMVAELTKRLGLASDSKLDTELWATGRLELTAEECLKRGLVQRIF